MQRWEYLVVAIDLAGGDRPLVRSINDVEVENWKQGDSCMSASTSWAWKVGSW